MELSHLRYFQMIAQSGSLTAAARVLKISQPTLTVAVQNLAKILDATLTLANQKGFAAMSLRELRAPILLGLVSAVMTLAFLAAAKNCSRVTM